MRNCYRCLLWLHPPVFRREFAGEMLWIFDQASESHGALPLFFDGFGSLARQWLLRSGWWKVALALSLAVLQMIFGGLAAVLFGNHQLVKSAQNPSITNVAEFSRDSIISHQPLTVGIVMYLAVFITGGLAIMIMGLSFWMKSVGRRRRPAAHRVR